MRIFTGIAFCALLLTAVPMARVSRAALGEDARLEAARGLFAKGDEGSCREAAMLCQAVNDADAASLMLKVMNSTGYGPGLPYGHYRDITWEGLVGLTDPYARARVELELKKNKSSAWVREWCAELLGIWGEPDFAPALQKALKDKDAYVVSAAAQALGKLRLTGDTEAMEKVQKALAKLAKSKSAYVRADGLIAALRLSSEGEHTALLAALFGKKADKDGGARCALVGALPEVAPEESEQLSARALDDDDWRVRLQAVDNLGGTKTKTAVDRLIDASEDGRPSVRLRAVSKLQTMTGHGYRKTKAWRAWWTKDRDTFTFPEGKAKGATASGEDETVAIYNGLHVTSDHVAFLIDKSEAMGEVLASRGMSKENVAQEQLAEVLGALPKGVVFNVYTYELDVQAFNEKHPVELNPKKVKKALQFVSEQKLRGSKDIWKVLERVVSDPDIDTIYLLSSGEPDTGKYVHWNRVTAHLKDLNRFHKVTVHTIAYSDNKWYRDQLEKISEATGGEFKWFE